MIEINPHISEINPYIPGKPIDEVQRELGLKTIIKLASNENNYGIPLAVQKELSRKIGELFLYPDGSLFTLRAVLSERYKLPSSQFIFGNGSDEILQIIALTYLGSGKEALLSEGTFSEYEFSARLVNAPFKKVSLKNYTYNLGGFIKAIGPKTKVIFLCNPNNPTGTMFSLNEFSEFMSQVPSHILVVLDEAYFEFAVGSKTLSGAEYPDGRVLLDRYENLIVLRTFSKMWAIAGCRIGYGMACSDITSALNKARQPFNVSRFSQEAALLMVKEVDWEKKVRQIVDEEKMKLMTFFSDLGLKALASFANFIFVFLEMPAKDCFEKLLKKGIIIRPMDAFGFTQAIRVTIGLPDENSAFMKAMREVVAGE